MQKISLAIAAILMPLSITDIAQAQPAQVAKNASTADYDRAVAMLEPNLATKIYNNCIRYRWIENGRALFYTTNDRDGVRHVRVDVATGARTIMAAPPQEAIPKGLVDETLSPDERTVLFRRADNLWVRDVASKIERQLTQDGEPFFSYAKYFDDSTRTIVTKRMNTKLPLISTFWSPDSATILGQRNDERKILPYPYVESVPIDGSFRPILHEIRMTLLGEPGRIEIEPFVIDVASGRKLKIAVPTGWQIDTTPIAWSSDNRKVFVLGTTIDRKGSGLFEIEVASGSVRKVIAERSAASSSAYFFNVFEYNYPNVRVLSNGRDAIWFSQRDGHARLYLYDIVTGRMKRALTPGAGVVLDIIAVDEPRRRLIAAINGADTGRDPYQRDLYSVPFDKGVPHKLTAAALDHEYEVPPAPFWAGILTSRPELSAVSPDVSAFVDIASDVGTPPVATLRSAIDGHVIAELERGDMKDATAMGWRPPLRFKAKAADGKTDIWGALYLPPDYDPTKKYPVINSLYGGPQLTVAPRNFNEGGPRSTLIARHSFAALGFIVVTVDGRGTPGRDLAFWRAGYGNFADPGIDDHVAAIRQLADLYSGIDLTRVGVTGHSFGGYVAARSMLRYPDFYKVGISSAAVHNWQGFRDAYEQYQGTVDYGNGARIMPTTTSIPKSYEALDNGAMASELKGKLLIAYADLDENATPSSTLQFVDALTRANKSYDLIYLANRTHGFGVEPYFLRRSFDYFVQNLQGRSTPGDYSVTMQPWGR